MVDAVDQIEAYLRVCRLDDSNRRYTLGPFFKSGVTLLKQQVRALNLIYALVSPPGAKLPAGSSMAVIGGGVAGVTAAAAAASLGREVYLFEQRPILCHLQHGCDTRWIHPRIYDWPEFGSDSPYAGLPILDWKADTAAEVTQQILTGFESIRDRSGDRFHLHLGASTWLSDDGRVRWDNSSGRPRGHERLFDVVILATGFGVEVGVREGEVQSYWRNDSVNQPIPGGAYAKPQQYLISGPGDGGLIDLIRTRIQAFNHGRVLDELFTHEDARNEELLDRLRTIVIDWKHLDAAGRQQRTWLFDRYLGLKEEGLLEGVMTRLEKRLRPDTASILNGKPVTFSETLRLDKASLSNSLIVSFRQACPDAVHVVGGDSHPGFLITSLLPNPERRGPSRRTRPRRWCVTS